MPSADVVYWHTTVENNIKPNKNISELNESVAAYGPFVMNTREELSASLQNLMW